MILRWVEARRAPLFRTILRGLPRGSRAKDPLEENSPNSRISLMAHETLGPLR